MIDVACPSCKANYQLDERRVPAQGMQMRCPKCGASFRVDHPSAGAPPEPAPVLGAALGLARPGAPPKKVQNPAEEPDRATVLGVAPQAGGPRQATRLELAEIEEGPPTEDDVGLLDFGLDAEADLPAPAARGNVAGRDVDLGLPDLIVDLPQASPAKRAPPAHPPKAVPRPGPPGPPPARGLAPGARADLPELSSGLPELGAQLPVSSAGLPDLHAGLPDLGAHLPDLGANLPNLGGSLPAPAGPNSINLPSIPAAFGESSGPPMPDSWPGEGGSGGVAPSSAGSSGEASWDPGADPFGTGPTTRPLTDPRGISPGGDLGQAPAPPSDDGEFDAFPTEMKGTPDRKATTGGGGAGGGTGYGEVHLDGDSGDLGLGESVAPPPRPDGLPGAPAAATAEVSRARAEAPAQPVRQKRQGVSKSVRIVGSFGILLALGGGALAVFPDIGPFGAFVVVDLVKKDAYESDLQADRTQAWAKLSRDTSADWDDAFRALKQRLESAPRFRSRRAFTAYVGLVRQLKFGSDGATGAEARALLESMKDENPSEIPYLELARSAARVLDQRGPDTLVADAVPGRDLELTVLSAETALREGQPEKAKAGFEALLPSARTPLALFGLARASVALEARDVAQKLCDEILALNPAHLGAKLLRIELDFKTRAQDENTMRELTEISGNQAISQKERARALTLLGDLHLVRARLKQAETAFNEALTLDAGSPQAQRGLADALFEAGSFSEALARYEAASRAAPSDVAARLGLVRAKLRLEQYDDASKILAELSTSHPGSTRILYWEGRAKEAIGDREAAEKAYSRAVEANQEGPELIEAMIALTRVLGQAGKQDVAQNAILTALGRFPNEPRLFRALGELAESRGRYDEAIERFDEALRIDPRNLGVRFQKGVALRKARRFEEAARELDGVEAEEKGYPGLSLERGNLFEAAGRSVEALRAYESALAQAPTDPDLMLRVGCGKAMAGFAKDAEALLVKVLEQRPSSAEVNFCLGLAYFKDGKDLPMAKRTIERAIGLDASRAPYHLYAGWLALEMRDFPQAGRYLDKAIELDQTMGDAYWQRGVLRVRQGAVDDAERDLRRALELSPSRYEAHASLAEAYLQMGKEAQALAEFADAVAGGPVEAYTEFRYGKLLLDNHRPADAALHLESALKKVPERGEPPSWVWEAHRELGMALGRRKEAIAHYKAFLENGPSDSPYRVEALREIKAILASIGK